MIYFDNSATTNYKPFCVRYALFNFTGKKNVANPGRSSHKLANKLAMKILEVRENINDTFGNNCVEHVVFTSGCTESLNTAIMGSVIDGGHIIITSFEHNSVIRPVHKLYLDKRITYDIIQPNSDGKIDITTLNKMIKPNTYLIIANQTSNVVGTTLNIGDIGKFCKDKKIMFLVDGAQSAGHEKIDMQKDNIDILCLAGHKGLLGPQGVGVLIYKKHIQIKPLKYGGTGVESENFFPPILPPESLEAGTIMSTNILALNKGIEYVKRNLEKINNKTKTLSTYFFDKLMDIKGVVLLTPKQAKENGILTFYVKGIDTNSLANYFSENNICIRSGLHCAPLIHKQLGTIKTGAIRASISFKNSKREVDRFVATLKNYLKQSHTLE